MWVFLREGFVSVVCARKGDGAPDRPIDKRRLMVRARAKAHLENLRRRFPRLRRYEIMESAHTDYRYRILVPKPVWIETIAALTADLDYGNYKDSVKERGETTRAFSDCLHRVWAEMARFQWADAVDEWGQE